MTDMTQRGNPRNLAPPSFHLAVVADTPKTPHCQLQRALGQPPSTNSTGNVLAVIQIPSLLLPKSKCRPRLPPRSASRSRRPLPPTLNISTSKYTITRPARPRPLLTTRLTKLRIQLPSPQIPIPSRPTVPNKRPSKATPSHSTSSLLTVQLPSATILASCDS